MEFRVADDVQPFNLWRRVECTFFNFLPILIDLVAYLRLLPNALSRHKLVPGPVMVGVISLNPECMSLI